MKKNIFSFLLVLITTTTAVAQRPVITYTGPGCLGSTPNVLYIASGDTVNATYQWYAWVPGVDTAWVAILGETNSTYTVDPFTVDAMRFRVEVTLPLHKYGSNNILICRHCVLATPDLNLSIARGSDGSRWFQYQITAGRYYKVILQSSTDGSMWDNGVAVTGQTSVDKSPLTGTKFYRLKGTLIAGGEEYSKVVRFTAIDSTKQLQFEIYTFDGKLFQSLRTTPYVITQTVIEYGKALPTGKYIFKFSQRGNLVQSVPWFK